MQALLIATGETNKLHPLTTDMPSPLLPVADRPVMVYAIELLARAGIRDIFVSLYEPDARLQSYFGTGERWNVRLHYLFQQTACPVTHALQQAAEHLTETFVVLPADALVDLDIQMAMQFHQTHGGVATAILSRDAAVKPAGSPFVTLDADNRLQPTPAAMLAAGAEQRTYLQTGAFIFEPTVFGALAAATLTADNHLLTTLCQADNTVYGYILDGYWNPLVTFRDFQAAQNTYLTSLAKSAQIQQSPTLRYPYVEAREVRPGIWIGPNSMIHASARLTAPLLIGAGCRIGRDVEVGPNTVIGSGVVLDEGVTVQESTILSHTYVGQFLHLAQRVAYHAELIDVATGVNVQIADPWLLSRVNPALPGALVRASIEKGVALLTPGLLAPFLGLLRLMTWLTDRGANGGAGQQMEQTKATMPLPRAKRMTPLTWFGWQRTPQLVQTQSTHRQYRERENQQFVVATFHE